MTPVSPKGNGPFTKENITKQLSGGTHGTRHVEPASGCCLIAKLWAIWEKANNTKLTHKVTLVSVSWRLSNSELNLQIYQSHTACNANHFEPEPYFSLYFIFSGLFLICPGGFLPHWRHGERLMNGHTPLSLVQPVQHDRQPETLSQL